MDIKTVERIVESVIYNDNTKAISLLYEELDKAKKNNRTTLAKKIQLLIKKIPRNKIVSSQGTGYFGSSEQTINSNSLYERIDSSIELKDIILNEDAEILIKQFLKEWDNSSKLLSFGVNPTNKLLFFGPPGTGKTKMAYAIANRLKLPLILVRLDEIISSYLGKTGKNIREIFDLASRENVVVFLDEIDTIAKHRDDETELGELKRVVTVLLQNIDNFSTNSILVGATNHEELLDKAIWRRFPIKMEFCLPNKKSRQDIFNLYLSSFKSKYNKELATKLTKNFNGSMIYDACETIKKFMIMSGLKEINDAVLLKGIFHIIRSKDPGVNFETKKTLYEMCTLLRDDGFSLKEISEISSIPYTTLRDNIN